MLNELLKDKLRSIADDELLIKAIEALINERIEIEKPVIYDEDNVKLGEKYRAYLKAKEIIGGALIDLKSYQSSKKQDNNFNKAI